MFRNLITGAVLIQLSAGVAAGVDGAFVNCTEIDRQGYDGVMIVYKLGAISAGGVITTRVKGSDTSATYGAGTIDQLGDDLANSADTDDGKFIVHDIYRPNERYVRTSYQRTVGNVVIESVFAVLYHADHVPVTQTEVEASQVLNGPEASTT